jgi:two-component system, NtrC family, sensor histidine kinase HydH
MWKKVIGPTILVCLLWIVSSTVTSYYFHRVFEYHTRALEEDVATIRAAWAMQDALWRLQAVVMEASGKEYRETRIEASELEEAFEGYLKEAEQTAFSPGETTLVKAAQEHFAVYRDHIESRLRLMQGGGPLNLGEIEKEKTIRLARSVAEPCRQLVELNERTLAESTRRSAQLSTAVMLMRIIILIAGPVVGLLFGLWVARSLHRSISQISVTLSDATGDLTRDVGSVEVRAQVDLPSLHQQVQAVAVRLRQVMEELQETRRQAMLADRLAAAGELAAGIAHELRNPLTSVKLLIQTAAQRQQATGLAGKQLQVVEQEIGRMENIIQGLLDFARPPELHRVPHDLRATVRRALNLVEGRAKQQNVSVVEQLPEQPVVVNGDPEQLHQTLVNLLLNGIEAMPQGGVLAVTIDADETGGGVCRVAVSDSGSGIAAALMERIFEPFVTNKEQGTGLGLAVSHRIAREHGGVLTATNRREGGAVFTLELPLSSEEANGKAAGN